MKNTERKQQLIAEGALHRTGAILARSALQDQARPTALVKRSLPSMVAATVSAWAGGGAGKLLSGRGTTLAISALPLLWKRLRSKDKKSKAAAAAPVQQPVSRPTPRPVANTSVVHPLESSPVAPRPVASASPSPVHNCASHRSTRGMGKATKVALAAAAAGAMYFYLRRRNKP